MSGVTPSWQERLEALVIILACLLLFVLNCYLAHIWRSPPRVMVPSSVVHLEGTCIDLETEWGG